jgi:hypothetical protein
MTSISALQKHPCAACGAQAEWNPARQALVCSFCGTAAPFEVTASGEAREHDLARALREIPDEERGWLQARRSVQCRSCRAVSVFDAERVGQNCGFCGSPQLVPYEEIKPPIRPESLLPFRITEAQVRERIRGWYAGKWLAPNRLRRAALVDRVRGVYVPYWTFDARVVAPWTADAGHYYYETETYRDGKGNRRTRRVRHTRWVPAAGEVRHFFDDEPVPGTTGVAAHLLAGVEPFPTAELVPYDPAFLSGFIVEHYQVVLLDAARDAESRMTARLRDLCAREVPGDTYRNLDVRPAWSDRTFKHILVPVWLLTYVYGQRSWQVVVNGVTGRVAGEYPKSAWKIALLVLIALVVLVALVLLQEQ